MIIKVCCNPKCTHPHIETKNPKKKFCSIYCKNQAAYLYHQTIYEWEVQLFKARQKNIQLLEYLINKEIWNINKEELKKMGFDFDAANIPLIGSDGSIAFRYGNIVLCQFSNNECKLFTFKNFSNDQI